MMSISHGRKRTFLQSEAEKGGSISVSDPTGRVLAFGQGSNLSILDVASKKLILTKRWPGLDIYPLSSSTTITFTLIRGRFVADSFTTFLLILLGPSAWECPNEFTFLVVPKILQLAGMEKQSSALVLTTMER